MTDSSTDLSALSHSKLVDHSDADATLPQDEAEAEEPEEPEQLLQLPSTHHRAIKQQRKMVTGRTNSASQETKVNQTMHRQMEPSTNPRRANHHVLYNDGEEEEEEDDEEDDEWAPSEEDDDDSNEDEDASDDSNDQEASISDLLNEDSDDDDDDEYDHDEEWTSR